MTRKTTFFVGWSWFKFNNLGLAIGTKLKFYSSLSKGLKLKVRKSWGLTLTFVEVTGEKLVGRGFLPPPPPPPSWIGLKFFQFILTNCHSNPDILSYTKWTRHIFHLIACGSADDTANGCQTMSYSHVEEDLNKNEHSTLII